MPQIIRSDDENATVLETFRNAIGLSEEKSRSILTSFQFRTPDISKKVRSLSGGEKSRLKLCLLMQGEANFLILDEPTNHLDILSREWIEDAVADWDGTMLFISHDRYFLNKFATKIWSMGSGKITAFDGGFDDYLRTVAENKPSISLANKRKKKPPAKSKEQAKAPLPFEALIYEAEAELAAIEEEIGLCGVDYEKMDALYRKKEQLEERVASLYDEWAKDSE